MAKILLLAGLFYFAGGYLKMHTFREDFLRRETEKDPITAEENGRQEVFGIGVGVGDGTVFWFHKRTESDLTDNARRDEAAGDS